jgi:hypothetical protein
VSATSGCLRASNRKVIVHIYWRKARGEESKESRRIKGRSSCGHWQLSKEWIEHEHGGGTNKDGEQGGVGTTHPRHTSGPRVPAWDVSSRLGTVWVADLTTGDKMLLYCILSHRNELQAMHQWLAVNTVL